MERFDSSNVINRRELPLNWPAGAPIPPCVSDTEWSASPAGLTPAPPNYLDGIDGALRGWTDATMAERIACYDATQPPSPRAAISPKEVGDTGIPPRPPRRRP